MNPENPTVAKLERTGWTAVKVAFIALVLMLVLNPATKGRSGFASSGMETVLPAHIRASGLYAINASMAGTVTELSVKPGDFVAAGQLLAVIVNPEIDGLVERTRRRMELAEARLAPPQAPTAPPQRRWLDEQHASAERNLRAAEQRLRDFSLADAEQTYARAKADAGRIRSLLDRHLATDREAEDSQRQADHEFRNLSARRESGARLGQELEAAQSQVKMARLQLDSAVPPPPADSGYARLEFEEAKSAYDTLIARRDGLRVTAERGGTIIQVNATQGGAIQEGAVLVQIANSTNLHFDVSAPATIAKAVHAGDAVLVRVPTDPPSEVPARVAQVLLEPDPQQLSYLIRVTIPNPAPDRLLVGLEGAVAFSH